MQCPSCQHKNPDNAAYCEECGTRLETVCPQCDAVVSPTAKFCKACGHDLSQPAVPPQTSTPEPSAPSGERRQATVVFSDLSGYTAMSERLDPEEVEGVMSRIKADAVRIVESHGGIVNQFVGDEVLALFGIPTAHEDDPRRAVRAALELHELVRRISPEVEDRIGSALTMQTGINTGLIVTHLRDDREGRYGLTGDTVNTGARLVGIAGEDQILLSPDTQRQVAPFFTTEAQDPVAMKGKAEPMIPHRVTGETAVETRFDAAEQRGLTAYVGRETELAALRNCLEKSIAGQGQLVTVVGEAGVGKSRLLYEFRHGIDREQVTVLQGRCQSYGAGTPYLPLLDALRRGLDLSEHDSLEDLHEKVVTNVRTIDATLEQYIPLYLHLLSIPSDEHPVPKRLTGPELAGALQEAVTAILTLNAQAKPMLLVLEDWHWVDEASNAGLKHLMGAMASYALMVVVMYRPEYEPTWANLSHHTPLVLTSMDSQGSEAIINAIWGAEELPVGIAALIHERAGGNAFFVEEVCNVLLEDGTVQVHESKAILSSPVERLALPDTIQAVIRTRLDRLEPQERETMRLASVIGREFAQRILKRVATNDAPLSASLELLKTVELIQQVRIVPEASYMFKHVLTQEVTYETLLKQKRKELHGLVARAIEELYADRIEEQVELLAHHYSLAEDWEKAVQYGRMAAEKARDLSQFQQSLKFYEQAVERISHLPAKLKRQETLVKIYVEIIWNLVKLGRWEKSSEIFQVAEPLALGLGDLKSLGPMHAGMALGYQFQGDFEKAEHHVDRAIKIARESGDKFGIASATQTLGSVKLGPGLWANAEPIISEAIQTYEKLNLQTEYPMGVPMLTGTIAYAQSGYALAVQGRIAAAGVQFAKGLLPAQQEVSNLPTRTVFVSWLGLYVALVEEDSFNALPYADQLAEIAIKSGSPFQILGAWVAKTNIFAGLKNFDGVKQISAQALHAIEGTGIRPGHLGNLYYNLALAELALGDRDAAQRAYDEGVPLAEMSPHWWVPRYDYLKGRIVSGGKKPDYEQAEALFEKSMAGDEAEDVGAVVLAAQTRYHMALMLAHKGDTIRASELLTTLRKQFKAWEISVWEKKCRKALTDLKSS